MPAAKPLSQQRKVITVSCSAKQKIHIDKLVAKNSPANHSKWRSKFILNAIFQAIALGDTDCGEKLPKHSSTVTFQVSCTPQQYELIKNFGDRIPNFKRSRWIVHQSLKSGTVRS